MVPGALLAGHLLIEVTPQTRKAKSMIFLVTQQKESLTVEQVPGLHPVLKTPSLVFL
jgi:hypothetical protein